VVTQSASHTAEHCLDQAAECYEKAAQCNDPNNKAIFLDLAKQWRKLARFSQARTPFNPVGETRPRVPPE
jgi:hypothetical protein